MQFFFVVIFSKILWKKGTLKNQTSQPKEGVSVVICSRNEVKNLNQLIPKLLTQDYPVFEVIIVDDRSEDGTKSLLENWKKKNKGLKSIYVKNTPQGQNPKKYALATGINQAKYEIILLTDADCLPLSDNWITLMQMPFEKGAEVVLGISPYEKQAGFLNKFIRFETFMTALQYLNWSLWGKTYMGVGRNLAYKKTIFEFHKSFWKEVASVNGGDDDLWVGFLAKKKYRIFTCIHPESQMTSIPKKTCKDWYKQKIRHLSVSKHYSFSNKWFLALWFFSLFQVHFLSIGFGLFFLFSKNIPYFNLITAVYLLRIFIFVVLYKEAIKKLNINLSWYYLYFLEIFYLLYLIFIGSIALNTKKIQWKN